MSTIGLGLRLGLGGRPQVARNETLTPVYRINASSSAVSATDSGPNWLARTGDDDYSIDGGIAFRDADITSYDSSVPSYAQIAGLYAQEFYGDHTQTFSLSEVATYDVNIFTGNSDADTDQVGERVFDITINSALVGDDIDLVALFGHQTAGKLTYRVYNTDTIEIEYSSSTPVEYGQWNAVEISKVTYD